VSEVRQYLRHSLSRCDRIHGAFGASGLRLASAGTTRQRDDDTTKTKKDTHDGAIVPFEGAPQSISGSVSWRRAGLWQPMAGEQE
jgi:hypothetical protein